jgi:drug/metabolite transporter (DMT)-like permease
VLSDGSAISAAGAVIAGQFLRLPLGAWVALLLLGLGSGVLANLWWLHILDHTTASRAGMALFLIPVISTVLSVVALHEPLTLTIIIGALLVLGGIAATQREHAQIRKTQIANCKSQIANRESQIP